ncbi:hypothetical protein MYX78_09025 [Acidobacteria bacterium AH-259-G07]|nr:hypothetical protein [Acidobacteria bacterium AH-259-G07]
MQQHPAESAIFHDALTSKSEQDVIAICDAYDFSDFRTIVDVGGGHGLLPNLRCQRLWLSTTTGSAPRALLRFDGPVKEEVDAQSRE